MIMEKKTNTIPVTIELPNPWYYLPYSSHPWFRRKQFITSHNGY